MMTPLLVLAVQSPLPQQATHAIQKVASYGEKYGLRLVPNVTPVLVVNKQDWRTVSLSLTDGRKLLISFGDSWQVHGAVCQPSRPPRAAQASPTSMQVSDSVELLRQLGWLRPADTPETLRVSRFGGEVYVWRKLGPLRAYGAAIFSFDGLSLRKIHIPTRLENTEHYVSAQRLSEGVLVARALSFYHAYHPWPEAVIQPVNLYLGFPVASFGHPEPRLSPEVVEDLRLKRPFPFAVVSITTPNGRASQKVFVDARTGDLVSYVDGSGMGGPAAEPTTKLPDLSRVLIGSASGRLTPTALESRDRPKYRTCLVRTGKHLFLAPIDAQGRLWIKAGGKPWRAYKPDAKLMKALKSIPKAAANRATSQAKACGPKMQTEVCAPIQG